MNLTQILNWFKSKVKQTKIERDILSKALPNIKKLYLIDVNYTSCTKKELETLLLKDFTNLKTYKTDYDCDNFAFKLCSNIKTKYPTLSFGIVFSLTHAYNVFIDNKGKVWYIEPQSDKLFSYSQLTKKYKPIDLIII